MNKTVVLIVSIMLLGVLPGCGSGDGPTKSRDASLVLDAASTPDLATKNDAPFFNPMPGVYTVRLDPADGGGADASDDPLNPLSVVGFEVWSYANGAYEMYIRPGYIFDVVNGEFSYAFSRDYDGTFETSIGLEIHGSFVSPIEARGRFTAYYKGQVKNGGNFIAAIVTDAGADSGVADLAVPAPDSGLDTPADTADAMGVDLPVFNPTPGHYAVRHDPAFPGDDGSVAPLSSSGFTVVIDASGAYSFMHSIDGWAKYTVSVINGSFDYKHGQGYEGYGGTNCPTDGFGIVGSFVSPTEARGRYKKMVRCFGDDSGYFIATLVPEPDSGVAPDPAASEAGAIDR